MSETFLADAQLPPVLARWLTARGHDAEQVADGASCVGRRGLGP